MDVRIIGRGRESTRGLELTLREGRKHEIRRVFEMFGYDVLKLKRVAIGPIKLGQIKRGHVVKLSEGQVRQIRAACGLRET